LDSSAVKYDNLSYDEVIEKKLGVMDLTAICLSRDHQVPIKVFNMNTPGALLNNVMGKPDGTHIA
jgi:uridylate kinase